MGELRSVSCCNAALATLLCIVVAAVVTNRREDGFRGLARIHQTLTHDHVNDVLENICRLRRRRESPIHVVLESCVIFLAHVHRVCAAVASCGDGVPGTRTVASVYAVPRLRNIEGHDFGLVQHAHLARTCSRLKFEVAPRVHRNVSRRTNLARDYTRSMLEPQRLRVSLIDARLGTWNRKDFVPKNHADLMLLDSWRRDGSEGVRSLFNLLRPSRNPIHDVIASRLRTLLILSVHGFFVK